MAPFYWWGSTASRLEPLRGGSLRFTTKFPEISGLRQTLKSCLLSLSKTAAIMWNVIHCCEIFLKYDWVRLFPIMPRSYALQQNWKIFVTKMTRLQVNGNRSSIWFGEIFESFFLRLVKHERRPTTSNYLFTQT